MPKIKVFQIYNRYIDEYDGNISILSQGVSDWEEVSDEDLQYIRSHFNCLENKTKAQLVLVVQDEINTLGMIKEIKSTIEKMERAETKRKEERKKIEQENIAKKLARKLEKDRNALKALIETNPDLVKEILS